MTKAPTCPLCKIRERDWDTETGPGGYLTHCGTCTLLSGYQDHSHTYYPSPVQVSAGTYPAGHSWRTAVSVRPLWVDGVHLGFRCSQFGLCGWERRFTAAEMKVCTADHKAHAGWPVEMIRGMCLNSREHRIERGECDERGHTTQYGRRVERERSNAANWDPGRYIAR